MRRWAGIIGGLVLVTCAMGAAGRTVSAAPYTDPDGRFTFLAPEGYAQRYRAGTDISYRSLIGATTTFDVAVVAQSPDALPAPDDFAANVLNTLKPPAYVGVSAPQPVVLGGQPGRRFDYYTVLEGSATRMRTLHIVAVTSRLAVVLIFAAPEMEYAQMVNDTAIVLLSFSFSRAPGAGNGSVTAGSATMGSVVAGTPSPPMPTPVASLPPTPIIVDVIPIPAATTPATALPVIPMPVAPMPFPTPPAPLPPPAFIPGPLPGAPAASVAPTVGIRRLGEG